MGIFQVVYLGASADEAYQRVQPLQPFTPFRDASCGPPSFNLSVLHCIQVSLNASCLHPNTHTLHSSWLLLPPYHMSVVIVPAAMLNLWFRGSICHKSPCAALLSALSQELQAAMPVMFHFCRVLQKQSRQALLTGSCPIRSSVWKSMSTMSRSKMEISTGLCQVSPVSISTLPFSFSRMRQMVPWKCFSLQCLPCLTVASCIWLCSYLAVAHRPSIDCHECARAVQS